MVNRAKAIKEAKIEELHMRADFLKDQVKNIIRVPNSPMSVIELEIFNINLDIISLVNTGALHYYG
jgi:hypothetical protein